MSIDGGQENLTSPESYPYELKINTVGNVSETTVFAVKIAVNDVFLEMNYRGLPPEFVTIAEGHIKLQTGEIIEACYNYEKEDRKPGRIYIGAGKCKEVFGKSEIPIEIAAAAFAAHEAVEHVNFMSGKKILEVREISNLEEHAKSSSEKEANSIARKTISKRYGWKVQFGDENFMKNKRLRKIKDFLRVKP